MMPFIVRLMILQSNQISAWGDWLAPVLPSFLDYTGKEPKTKFLLKSGSALATNNSGDHRKERLQVRAKHVAGHACDVRYIPEIQFRAFRIFHIEPAGLVKHSAADSMPVIPTAKVFLRQSISWNHVMNHQVR